MPTAIVLSKDRAAQCHLFLESLYKNCKLFDEICVLYTYSSPEFERGYQLLAEAFPEVDFFKETIFREDILACIRDSHNLVSFFVDDNICYKECKLKPGDVDSLFSAVPELGCLSLRLGMNCHIQDIYTNTLTMFPPRIAEWGEFLVWNWQTVPQSMNFGYPLSVDGTVFKRERIERLLEATEFTGPNMMEGNLQRHLCNFPPLMACLHNSVVVNSPTNRVQDVFKNNAGKFHGMSAEDMNATYLEGHRLCLQSISGIHIASCHQELPLEFSEKDISCSNSGIQ